MKLFDSWWLQIIVLPIVSLVMAYLYGNDGFEAFLSLNLTLTIVLLLRLAQSTAVLFTTKAWMVAKVLTVPLLLFFALCSVVLSIMTMTAVGHDPRIPLPHANWLIVLLTTLLYLVAGRYVRFRGMTANSLVKHGTIAFYSLIIFFLAGSAYYREPFGAKSLVLIIAMQLQYVLAYLVIRLHYVERVIRLSRWITLRWQLNTTASDKLTMLLAATPFVAPLFGIVIIYT